jgi:hypothetical protein
MNLAEDVTFVYFVMQVEKLTYDWFKDRVVYQNSNEMDDVNELLSLN